MSNDISISVRVSNDTADGLAAVNASLRELKNNVQQAGRALNGLATKALAAAAALRALHAAIEDNNRALRTLRGRAAAAAVSLHDLRDGANGANTSLRTLNTRAQTADGRLNTLSDRTRTLHGDMDGLDGSLRNIVGNLGGLRSGLGNLPGATARSGDGMQKLRAAAIALAPALIPIAAATVPLAAGIGAAAVAVGAFGLAIGGQIKNLADAAEAQKKYDKAVREHGKGSEQAAKAETEYLRLVGEMPPATRAAAAAFGILKDQYKGWSDSLADSTMPVVTKSFATFGALLPRLTPLVRGASSELDRLMTVMAGGIQSQGFERFMASFSSFAEGALSKATDGLIRFSRVMSGGAGAGAFTEFMDYARSVGPAVGETLGDLAKAMVHLVASASDLGVSMLGVVNAVAGLVNAIPGDAIATFLQLALAFKGVKLAAAGFTALSGALAAFGASIAAMRTAAAGASGGLAALTAAFGALSRGAKVALIGTGVGILVVALSKLSEMGKKAPPDVDKLTTSLGKLAQTGKVSGEAARAYGKDFGELEKSLRTLARPSGLDQVQQFLLSWTGWDSTPVKEAKEQLDGFDKGLANLVKSGNADLAEAALKRTAASFKDLTPKELRSQLGDYKSALADMAFEQQLAADAMGLFGQQAISVQGKLDAQKASADGLRQSIQALNDVNRAGLGGMIAFEAAIDAAAEAAKKNAGALSMTGGRLNVNSEKAQAAATALSDLAAKTDEAAAAARQSDGSWARAFQIYDRGRKKLIEAAQAMGLTRAEAKRLANQILKTPDKTARIKGNLEDLEAKLKRAKGQLARVPDSRRAKIRAELGQLRAAIGWARVQLAALQDKTVTVNVIRQQINKGYAGNSATGARASGGLITGPGSGTSDDVPIMASNGEYVVKAASVQKYGTTFLDALNQGTLRAFARGGRVSKAEREARSSARGDLTISHFGWMAGYRAPEFRQQLGSADSLGELVNSLNKWRGIIKAATSGSAERGLLRALNRAGEQLLKQEKALLKVNSALDKAKDKLSGLKDKFAQLRDSIASGIVSSANITGGAQNGPVSVSGIIGGLTTSRDQAKSLATALDALRKRGLNKNILEDIAQAGTEGGGLKTAEALMSASGADIKRINELQKQIQSSAQKAGKTTADAMYGAGIKAAEGLVSGLKSQQKHIEKAMMDIAKSMEKAIKKALGIRSPSRVMEQVGHFTAEGFAQGVVKNRRGHVAMLDLVRPPRSSPKAQYRHMSAAGGASGQPIMLVVNLDGKTVARQLFDPFRNEIRNRAGGNVQRALGWA